MAPPPVKPAPRGRAGRSGGAARPQERVITVAIRLFSVHGYAATSVRHIARDARVSLDTVYACGSKAEIFLKALEAEMSGGVDGVPLLQAEGMDEVWQAPTLEAVVAGLVDATVGASVRSARLWPAFVEAAGSDAVLSTALDAQNEAMRAEGRRAVAFFKQRGFCDRRLDTDRIADLIWAEAHPNRYALLVGHAGWTREEFSAQLVDSVLTLLGRKARPGLTRRPKLRPASTAGVEPATSG